MHKYRNYYSIILFLALSFMFVQTSYCNADEDAYIIFDTKEVIHADKPDSTSLFIKYLNIYHISADLYNAAIESVRRIYMNDNKVCTANNNKVQLGDVYIIEPVKFSHNAQNPIAGVWMHKYELHMCNEKFVFNTWFMAKQDDNPIAAISVIGNSELRNPKDAAKASTMAVKTAVTQIKHHPLYNQEKCPDDNIVSNIVISDTSLLNRSNDNEWNEIWTVKMCSLSTAINIRFSGNPAELNIEVVDTKFVS